jgi:hypothetical protein
MLLTYPHISARQNSLPLWRRLLGHMSGRPQQQHGSSSKYGEQRQIGPNLLPATEARLANRPHSRSAEANERSPILTFTPKLETILALLNFEWVNFARRGGRFGSTARG